MYYYVSVMIFLVIDIDQTLYNTNVNMDYEKIQYDEELYQLLNTEYPKFILTNATFGHADIIVNKLKLSPLIKKIYSRDNVMYMKPHKHSYTMVENDIYVMYADQSSASIFGNDSYYFFDDLLENLEAAKKVGWNTIWIHPDYAIHMNDYVDYSYPDIKSALKGLRYKNVL
jgi:FMN phosphatase YigB (HAD superfamily)